MSDLIYRPLIEGMTWSYSRIDCFNSCRYKWFLRYIDDVDGTNAEPMFYSSYGSFMHEIIEKYYKGKLAKEDMVAEFLCNFSAKVVGKRPSESIVQKYIQLGVEYLKGFEPFPYNCVAVEKKVHFKLNGDLFVGVIDFLGEKDGEYYIVDNKSRELKPRSNRKKPTAKDAELDEMLVQLYLYAEAVKQEYGKYPKALCFNCFKNRVFIEEPFDENKLHDATSWAAKTIERIKNVEDFYPNIDFFYCRNLCEYSHECCYCQ